MGFIDGFLDKMKLNGNYDEDEEYDGYDDDEEEDVTPKVRNSRKKNDDIFSSSKNNTDDDDFGDLEEKIIKSTDTRPVKPARVSRNSSASRGSSKNSSSKVVSMQGKFNPMEVCVIKPTNVEDGREIAETLLSGRAVILNLEGGGGLLAWGRVILSLGGLDMELAQRIIDFSGGACFAIDGKLKKVSNYIFIATPSSISISGDLFELFSNDVSFGTDSSDF